MELNAVEGIGGVAKSHDFAIDSWVLGPGGDDQVFADGFGGDAEAVITGGGEGVGESLEDSLAIVVDLRDLAVHETGGADDGFVEDFGHTLVPEADAEDGDEGAELADDFFGDAGFAGCAGAGGDDDPCGSESTDFLE